MLMCYLTLAYLALPKGIEMTLIKPNWHNGNWTFIQQVKLIEELVTAEATRSLTNEEAEWLRKINVPSLN
jgi:hypothetical protein